MIFTKWKLPAGWRWEELHDHCDAIRGVTFPSGEATYEPFDGGTACLTTSAVQQEVDWDSRRFILGHRPSTDQLLRPGDLLVSTANSKALVGKSSLVQSVPFRCTFGAFVTVLRPKPTLKPILLAYWMRTEAAMWYCFQKSSNTTNISNLRVPDLLTMDVPLPPLEEQERIAAILKHRMATIDRARTAAQAQLEAAQALPAAYLRAVFNTPQAQNWPRYQIIDLISSEVLLHHQDGNHGELYPRTTDFAPTGVRFLAAQHMTRQGALDFEAAPCISKEQAAGLRIGFAQANDVLLAHNATVGPVAFAAPDCEPFVVGTSLTIYRPDPNHMLPRFLFYALQSPDFQAQLFDAMKQTTRNQVPITRQRLLHLPVPPLSEQEAIVRALPRQMEQAEKIQTTLEEQLGAVGAIPGALLRRAFHGEL